MEANSSQFINNWRTADFMRYNSGNKEQSYFREYLFSIDEGLRSTTVTDFLGHLSIWGVNALTV